MSDTYYDNFDPEVDGFMHGFVQTWWDKADLKEALQAIDEGYLAGEAIDYIEALYPSNDNVQYLVTQLRDLIKYVADLQMG